MHLGTRIGLALCAAGASEAALAQASGYDVNWGPMAVPMSPWANALIGLMLALAAYAFLRRHAKGGMMLLVGALATAGLTLHVEKAAYSISITSKPIESQSGSMSLDCAAGGYDVYTDMSGGITITVKPWTLVPVSAPTGNTKTIANFQPAGAGSYLGQCTTGMHLNPGEYCTLCYTPT